MRDAGIEWPDPAAPVVQSEPDEEPIVITREDLLSEFTAEELAGPARRLCTVCSRPRHAHIGRGHDFTPAAPVVQPEPGDRADQWTKALKPWQTFTAGDGALSSGSLTAEELAVKGMALADSEVAAAVAAVRADLLREVNAEILPYMEPDLGDDLLALVRGQG